jgi:hypothetical protein
MIPHFLDSRLIDDGGEVVSLTLRSLFTPQENSWYSFLLEVGIIPRAIVPLKDEINGKSPLSSKGIEPATFYLVT